MRKNKKFKVKIWQLLLVLLIMLPINAWLLRKNNLGMVERRERVIIVDELTGDIKEVEPTLIELRNYINSHMNTGMAQPLELPGVYNATIEDLQGDVSDPRLKKLYRKGELKCSRASVPVATQAQCIQDYVAENAGSLANKLVFPPKEQFIYDFTSPRWSLDLAGISVLVSAGLMVAISIKLVAKFAWPRVLKYLSDDDLE